MNETKKPLNFCVCVIEADNKGKKKKNQHYMFKLCTKPKHQNEVM